MIKYLKNYYLDAVSSYLPGYYLEVITVLVYLIFQMIFLRNILFSHQILEMICYVNLCFCLRSK